MKTKFLTYPILAMSLGFMAASCSSDSDDNDEPDIIDAVEMPIPSSIVDGVRVANDGAVKVNYNSDGTIKDAEYNGTVYDFVYEENSRAATLTKRKLVYITARGFDDTSGESWQATNFQYNTDGFIASYLEKMEERNEYGFFKQTLNTTISYNGENRISSMNLSGSWEESYEGERDSGKASGTIKYTYNGGALESAKLDFPDESNSYTYEYSPSHTNTYNIVTPQLGAGMGFYSPIAYVFATTGYLGNASALLPSKITQTYIDHEDPENSGSESYGISYTFNDKNRITSISSTAGGISYTTSMIYIEQ